MVFSRNGMSFFLEPRYFNVCNAVRTSFTLIVSGAICRLDQFMTDWMPPLIQDDTKSPCFLRKMSEKCFLGLAFEKISGKIKAFLPS